MKSHLTKITICTLVLALAGIARADQAAAGKPGEGHSAVTTTPVPAPAAAEPTKDWSVTVGADWYSEYIFRGVDLLKNNSMFSPSVVGKYKGLTAYYYGYFGYGRDANPSNKTYTENDFAVDWTQTLVDGKLALTGGGYWYTYPNGKSGPDTFEFYGKAAWTDNILNPYIALNWDIDAYKGAYAAVGVSHTFDISKQLNLKDGMTLSIIPSAQLGIDLGYNSKRSQSNVNWNDVLLGVNVPFYITPAFCLHAQAQISIALNSLSDLNQGNERIFNLGASYAF